MGQWATADMGDSQRQKKFYQLLGGFKRGSANADSQPSGSSANKFNSALDKRREDSLNNRLERQFEQARFTSLNARGLGLGFGNRNAMDTSSRSKKFDDSD